LPEKRKKSAGPSPAERGERGKSELLPEAPEEGIRNFDAKEKNSGGDLGEERVLSFPWGSERKKGEQKGEWAQRAVGEECKGRKKKSEFPDEGGENGSVRTTELPLFPKGERGNCPCRERPCAG